MRKHHKGFTLIEVLVALVVLCIGLLGIAALQLTSLKSNHGSAMRTQATYLAYEIVDRMRANRNAALSGAYDTEFEEVGTAGTVAGDDLVAWKNNINNTLPSMMDGADVVPADGAIERNGNIFTVTIRWSDLNDAGGTDARTPVQFAMETQLQD